MNPAAKPDGSPDGRDPHRLGSKKILVVEDSPVLRECIAQLVLREGFCAETARDGAEAWSAICSKEFDMIITDHQMPKMTGLNLIRKVREASIEAPCILISSDLPEPETTLMPLIRPGATVAKPFKFETLMKVVISLLKQGALEEMPKA
jgi:DNA-binding response OmpR family regulator